MIARGEYGVVYAEEGCAVKQVPMSDYAMLEVKALGAISHPNVVKLLRHGVVGGNLRMVFPLYPGTLAKGAPGLARDYLRQIRAGLEAIHASGYTHCDLKPSNVLVDGPRAVVADLGMAQKLRPGKQGELPVVCYSYRAPEIFSGDPYYTSAIDVFALGVLAFELLCHRELFMCKEKEMPAALVYFYTAIHPLSHDEFQVRFGGNMLEDEHATWRGMTAHSPLVRPRVADITF